MFNIRMDPDMPDHMVRIEQDGKVLGAIINLKEETKHQQTELSIASLKANLYYYELLKLKAFEEHKAAIIKAHEAMTALNNALLKVR